jgi:hypothetical protein
LAREHLASVQIQGTEETRLGPPWIGADHRRLPAWSPGAGRRSLQIQRGFIGGQDDGAPRILRNVD